MVEGTLFYVIGPSGSGKDSLLRYARERLASNSRVVFAHRYITRPVEVNGENHIALSDAEFAARINAGLFALHWQSHGLRYGIGRELDLWLAKGCNVVVNGSREYLTEARHRYPSLLPVLITASPETLVTRLRQRGRESEEQIAQRIRRATQFPRPEGYLEVIENDGALSAAGERFVALLSAFNGMARASA